MRQAELTCEFILETVVVGGTDYVTVKVAGGEVNGLFCLFEVSTSPEFGPPLHSHYWAESFYVLVGAYELDHVEPCPPP